MNMTYLEAIAFLDQGTKFNKARYMLESKNIVLLEYNGIQSLYTSLSTLLCL